MIVELIVQLLAEGGVAMLAIERQNRILSNLKLNQTALVSDLSKEFRVTEETIRRDLEKLEKQGFVKKTYGGAIYGQDNPMEIPLKVRQQNAIDTEISKKAAELVQDGDSIMLDASDDSVNLARLLRQKKDLRIVTNSIEILSTVGYRKNIKVISTGGVLQESGLSLAGPSAGQCIHTLHVNKAFLSCDGLDQDNGATERSEQEAEVKRAMAAAASQVILMVGAEKFDIVSFVRFLDFDQIRTIVTSQGLSEAWLSFFHDRQIKCIS
jgi:DeoR/GlpR family transcriptional regulator of sugar metabolism